MLKIEKLNKYFYKGKSNELHVINNTSIEFGDTGLVSLLGPSGSGKTTLLNVIGGLDKWHSGSIYLNNKRITRRQYKKLDKLRNLNIGYIFQDYKIIDDMTVFDNVALSLKMIGIKDKEVIQERVNYVLEVLELYRYRKRPASMLSGGERQRVGIARAIAKNPDIIICDEPTGNLDSQNSIEIMNIIKSISMERLVILVTHEVELANFYSDRIITLEDGKILSDKINDSNNYLDYQIDNKIYLKDMKNHFQFDAGSSKINYYFDKDDSKQIDIVIRDGNLYIKANENVEVINDDSRYELVDEHYKQIDKSIYEKYHFRMENYEKKNSSILSLTSIIRSSLTRVRGFKGLKKFMLFCYIITGAFVMFCLSIMFGVTKFKVEDYVKYNDSYVYIKLGSNTNKIYDELVKVDGVNYIIPNDSLTEISFVYDDIYQTLGFSGDMTASVAVYDLVSSNELIYGTMPAEDDEVIIDKMLFDYLMNNADYLYAPTMVGINSVDKMIGRKVKVNDLTFIITGIVNKQSPCVYFNNKVLNKVTMNNDLLIDNYKFDDYTQVNDSIKVTKGHLPNDYEVIVNKNMEYIYPLKTNLDSKINGKKVAVVGYYESDTISELLFNTNTIDRILIENAKELVVSTDDKNKLINDINTLDLAVVPQDLQEKTKNEYISTKMNSAKSTAMVSLVILVVTLIEIYFMIRSSFMSRIKEVGILRSVGVKKGDIYKMFLGEIICITTIYGGIGVVASYFVIDALTELVEFKSLFAINPFIGLLSMAILYVFTIIIGLLPVYATIKKTPAQILSRKDV